MRFGPIVWPRGLIVSARKPLSYVGEGVEAAVLLAVVGMVEACVFAFGWDRTTVAAQNQFVLWVFAALAGVVAVPALMACPSLVAPGIAAERDKKSLDALLTTRLSSAEVVAGKLAAGLLPYLAGVLAGVPVLLGVTYAWGVDVRLVVLTYAGVAATAFASGSVTVWVSAHARDARKAMGYSLLLIMVWAYFPFLSVFLLPRLWPRLAHWVSPVAFRLLDAGPMTVLMHLGGSPGAGRSSRRSCG